MYFPKTSFLIWYVPTRRSNQTRQGRISALPTGNRSSQSLPQYFPSRFFFIFYRFITCLGHWIMNWFSLYIIRQPIPPLHPGTPICKRGAYIWRVYIGGRQLADNSSNGASIVKGLDADNCFCSQWSSKRIWSSFLLPVRPGMGDTRICIIGFVSLSQRFLISRSSHPIGLYRLEADAKCWILIHPEGPDDYQDSFVERHAENRKH